MKRKEQLVFFTLIIAQFCGTSLWFAGNAVFSSPPATWPHAALGFLIASVQLGFISGTLLFAVLGLADRYATSRIFFYCCIAGALSNALALIDMSSFPLAIGSRIAIGFWLAGIYPVGMKIAADWQEKGLGNWLGSLVGALVLGTAFPYGLKIIPGFVDPINLLITVSALAVIGGLCVLLLVPDGPYRKRNQVFSFSALKKMFRVPDFRRPAFGYFGHMWELYAFYTFLPWLIYRYQLHHDAFSVNSSWLAFSFIVAGSVGCWAGGRWSIKNGSARIAFLALLTSGVCCLLSPFTGALPPWAFVLMMLIWGFAVSADSPQFSTLVARHAPEDIRGSAITLVTSIGFFITIISIQLLGLLQEHFNDYLFLALVPGPVFGLISMFPIVRRTEPTALT